MELSKICEGYPKDFKENFQLMSYGLDICI